MQAPYLLFWGKTSEKSELIHPLLFHMMDAGNVAAALWSMALPEALKQDMADALKIDIELAGKLLSYWTALHDMGKASPAFQVRHAPSAELFRASGLDFPPEGSYLAKPHGLVTGWILCREGAVLHLEEDEREALGRVLSGHHGKWPDSEEFNNPARRENLGKEGWRTARKELWNILAHIFCPPDAFCFPEEGLERNVFLTLVSGLVSVADWLASMQYTFPAAGRDVGWEKYQVISVERANQAVVEQGWTVWNDAKAGAAILFEEAFPQLGGPRAVQTAVFEKAFGVDLPAMALIEAPTGIGKTEIAFLVADRWLRRSGGRGLYVAMPTQATSNQMYERTKAFLQTRYTGETVHLQLAHGHALLQADFERTITSSIGENRQAGAAAATWFLPRKRTLLGPFGVGTVDQVFLSVLQTKHFFVRLFGLYGKVVLFDEIHAYDAYQSELFCRLLRWLRALNVSVILLSATLPAAVREKFLSAYGGKEEQSRPGGYPRLTLVGKDKVSSHELPAGESRPVKLDRLGHGSADITAYLKEQMDEGGCAAVICNTVARAQTVYQAVKEAGIAPDATYLFHARFPFAWRDAIEKRVLDTFGRQGERPKRAVVVATQVIEQSLDLDFDLMISELAPIDLLIQRVGRLHRHQRANRPARMAISRLALMETGRTPEGDPDFGVDSYVYRRYHLLRTEAVLTGRDLLMLPEETPCLIEAVYGEGRLNLDERTAVMLAQARIEMEEAIQESTKQARRRIVLPPERDDLLTRRSEDLEEESPAVHSDFQALTREAPPGASLVCLHALPDGRVCLEPGDETTVIDLHQTPDKEVMKKLLRYTVQVQRAEVVAFFAGRQKHAAWKECAALQYHQPVVFHEGRAALDGLRLELQLDRALGLSFTKPGSI